MVHPVIDYNYIVGTPVAGGELSFTAHARAMTRTDGTNTNHAVVEANWRRKMIDPVGQVWTPFGNVRGDVYSWTDARDPNNPDRLHPGRHHRAGNGRRPACSTPIPFVAHAGWASHVFEPTAQVIVRPNRIDQRRTPDEDARSLVFDDTLLFDIDKFSGYDRLETGTRANIGVQYTLQGNNGLFARAVFGQSLHLSGDNAFADPGLTVGVDPLTGLPTTPPNFSPSKRPAERSFRLCGRLVPVAVQRHKPRGARPLRREGLDTPPPGFSTCRPTTGRLSPRSATRSRVSTRLPVYSTPRKK